MIYQVTDAERGRQGEAGPFIISYSKREIDR